MSYSLSDYVVGNVGKVLIKSCNAGHMIYHRYSCYGEKATINIATIYDICSIFITARS